MDEQPIQERIDFLGAGPMLRPRPGAPDVAGAARALARALSLSTPLVFLDLETTGLDPRTDRVVELSLARVDPGGRVDTLSTLVDPGVPVPPATSAIHGIADPDVRGAPTLAELASRVARRLRGADLAGYNLSRFDLPLLRAELSRSGIDVVWDGARVIDASVIFRRMERRNLEAAYRFYVGGPLPSAHTAAGDVAATMEVLVAQLQRYPELPRQVAELAVFCEPRVPAPAPGAAEADTGTAPEDAASASRRPPR